MKEHIIPYVIDEANRWWTGINLTNHSYNPTSVLLDYYLLNGTKLKSEEIVIPAMGMKTYMIDVYYRAWIKVISDNNVSIIIFTGTRDAVTNENSLFAPVAIPVEKRDVVVRDTCDLNPSIVKIGETAFIRDCSQTNNYLTRGYWDILQLLARWMHYRYPDRPAQKLEINDASTLSGPAEGHPTGSHILGMDCDFCYYLRGNSNHSQRSINCEGPNESLWSGSGRLNDAVFDADRNVDLIIKLNELFPNSKIFSYEGFKDTFMSHASRMYGVEMAKKFDEHDFIQYDDIGDLYFNHHTHLHVGLGGSLATVNGGVNFGMH